MNNAVVNTCVDTNFWCLDILRVLQVDHLPSPFLLPGVALLHTFLWCGTSLHICLHVTSSERPSLTTLSAYLPPYSALVLFIDLVTTEITLHFI